MHLTKTALMLTAIILTAGLLSGCGGGSSSNLPAEGPTPVIDVTEGHAVNIGATLHISGTNSIPLEGVITTYEWVLVRPAGSTATLSSASTPVVTLTPDVAGDYTFHLNVWDSGGNPNVKVISYVVTAS